MKKTIAFLLTFVMVLGMVGCGNSAAEQESTPIPTATPKPGPTDSELKQALSYIKEAEDYIIKTSTVQIGNWDAKYSSFMVPLFDDQSYETKAKENPDTITQRLTDAYNYRQSAQENLDSAKNILGTSGDGEFYEAVKEYYKVVNKFMSLVSTFPEGYSELTFSSTVADYKSECQSAYEDASFFA